MKKNLISLLVMLLLVMTAVGCARRQDGNTPGSNTGTNTPGNSTSETGESSEQPGTITIPVTPSGSDSKAGEKVGVSDTITIRENKDMDKKDNKNEGLSEQDKQNISDQVDAITSNQQPAEDTSSVNNKEYDNTGTTTVTGEGSGSNQGAEGMIINEDGDDTELPILP